jgi:hypothetical protein
MHADADIDSENMTIPAYRVAMIIRSGMWTWRKSMDYGDARQRD